MKGLDILLSSVFDAFFVYFVWLTFCMFSRSCGYTAVNSRRHKSISGVLN